MAAEPLFDLVLASAGEDLAKLRERRVETHVLTSPVAQKITADALLALGAETSMSSAPDEIESFAARADAFCLNLGMLDPGRREAAGRALPILNDRGAPWVLDPVKVERSAGRARFARELCETFAPTIVKANRAEAEIASSWRCAALARTGAEDRIASADGREIAFAFGSPLATRATAIGCAIGGLLAAFAAIRADPFLAAAGGLLTAGIAIEIAASRSNGPGEFQFRLLDALFEMDQVTLATWARPPEFGR